MRTDKLIECLLQIEGLIGKADGLALQGMLRNAEDFAITMQRKYIELLEENERLTRLQGIQVKTQLDRLSFPPVSEAEAKAMELSRRIIGNATKSSGSLTIN
jgi:hypothetical protein